MPDTERVLHVLNSMNCGGAESLIMNILRNIDREKYAFDFLLNEAGEMYYQSEIEQLGGRIYRMKSLRKLGPYLYKKKLTEFFSAHPEFKIVHSHLETTTGIILACAKKAGVPLRIAHAHNSRFTRTGLAAVPENLYKNRCRGKIKSSANCLLACSECAARWLYPGYYERATVLKNGIDAEKFRFNSEMRQQMGEELDVGQDTAVLMHTGRFCDQKNHLFLLDVFSAYHGKNKNSVLLMVGEGPLKNTAIEKVKKLKIDGCVRFLGLRDDVERLLQRADVFLLPSKFEGLPLALVEAQCSGADCLVSDTVTREADFGGAPLRFLPLDNAEIWARNIKKSGADRTDSWKKAVSAGYDIKSTAKEVEGIYDKLPSVSK